MCLPEEGSSFAAATGKLSRFSRFGHQSQHGRIEVIRYWPDPRCWVKELRQSSAGLLEDKGWRGATPVLGLHYLDDPGPKTSEDAASLKSRRTHHRSLAMERIPDEVRRGVLTFGRAHHWSLLSLLARAPRFLERLETQPLLVLAVANASYFKERPVSRPYRSARRLEGRRSVDILRWLDWPSPKSALKLFGRLDPSNVELADLSRLRKAMRSGQHWVRHFDPLNRSLLLILDSFSEQVGFQLLEEASQTTNQREHKRLLQKLRKLFRSLKELPTDQKLPKVRDSMHLEELLAAEEQRRRCYPPEYLSRLRRGPPKIEVAPSPFPASSGSGRYGLHLRALTTRQELFKHANRMMNCVATNRRYLGPLESGRGAAYELSWYGPPAPTWTQGTAFLWLGDDGRWVLRDIALANNAKAPDWLRQAVSSWVDEHAPTPGEPEAGAPDTGG